MIVHVPTWQSESTEAGAEDEDAVADVAQPAVLHGPGAEDDEDDHEDGAVGAVVQVAHGWSLYTNISNIYL